MVENSSAAQKPKMPIHVNSPDMCRVSSKVLSHTALVAVVVQHEMESDIEMVDAVGLLALSYTAMSLQSTTVQAHV